MAIPPPKPIRTDPEALAAYVEWLARMEVGVASVVTIERLQEWMDRRFIKDDKMLPTDEQVEAVFGAKQAVYRFQEAGLKPFNSRTAIGASLRFGVTGMRGAFGLTRARAIFFERTGGVAPF
ncbi:hypothetical protein LCGC14_1460910 [marine sediment metagenome]|uniref:Uncharacterized protein n=1 Tax=marine sediment metagenome TaxID=412755 RepID=A0A0F9MH55_9ZZZZ